MVHSNVNVKVASLRAMESARTMTNVTIKHTTAQRMKSVKTWVKLRIIGAFLTLGDRISCNLRPLSFRPIRPSSKRCRTRKFTGSRVLNLSYTMSQKNRYAYREVVFLPAIV